MRYIVDCSADGYEPTFFRDYATARDYFNKLKSQGFNVEFSEESDDEDWFDVNYR